MANQANGLLSPWLRNKRINAVLPYLKGRILDYGCGVGLLAEKCDREQYYGFDIDIESIKIAQGVYPKHRFSSIISKDEKFDTIVLLAVIEHIKNKVDILCYLDQLLALDGSIVLTTPHPLMTTLYSLGSKIGIFSSHAAEEHGELLDYNLLKDIVSKAGLKIYRYRRFLLGANQLCVISRKRPLIK